MQQNTDAAAQPTARDLKNRADILGQRLFDDPGLRTWAVLDGARVERLVREIESQGVSAACLLAGELDPSMARAAPYLVELERDSDFFRWLLERGWGRSWGIFVRFAGDLTALRRHLRGFLQVRVPDGRTVYFRYYDPRVFRLYLPTCNAVETATVFGPVGAYAMESEDGRELLVFSPETAPPKLARVPLSR
jgi:hypothetical protein